MLVRYSTPSNKPCRGLRRNHEKMGLFLSFIPLLFPHSFCWVLERLFFLARIDLNGTERDGGIGRGIASITVFVPEEIDKLEFS